MFLLSGFGLSFLIIHSIGSFALYRHLSIARNGCQSLFRFEYSILFALSSFMATSLVVFASVLLFLHRKVMILVSGSALV